MDEKLNYDWDEYDDGRIGLIFTPPWIQAFVQAGYYGDGNDWARLLQYFLPRVAPDALEGTEFDPESDMFVAINRNPLALQKMVAVIESLLADEASLKVVLRSMQNGI